MRLLPAILFAAVCISTPVVAALDTTFIEAQNAYDAGQYKQAAALYETLLSEGVVNPEVHYNLANACFRNGNLPKAVWHYRKAWYSAPRDPDISANLHFALAATGAIEPAPGFAERMCTTLPLRQWVAVAVGSYLLLMALLLTAWLAPSLRRTWFRLCLIPLMLLLLAGGGGYYWQRLSLHPEWVVVRTDATALFGPIKGSTAHYKLPLGALVRQRDTNAKGWIEIEYDGKRGWIPTEYITLISP